MRTSQVVTRQVITRVAVGIGVVAGIALLLRDAEQEKPVIHQGEKIPSTLDPARIRELGY